MKGTLDEHVIASDALRGNPLGDPHERPLWVYTPPGYAGGPTVYVLQGYTGQLEMWRNRVAFRPTFLELLDREDIDARVVFVDASTSLGGSQFVDSNGGGRYHTYICDEIVPFVDAQYESNGFRGVAGKSSGGSGPSSPRCCAPTSSRAWRATPGAASSRSRSGRSSGSRRDGCAMPPTGRSSASSRSFGPARHRSRICTTCTSCSSGASQRRTRPTRTGRSAADGLCELRAIYVDAGTRDEWYLDLTAAWLRRELAALPVRDLHVELFDATHLAIEYRYPIGLWYLADRLR